MPDSRGRPLPSEILAALKDPAVQNYLRSFLISTTSSESIGRYPGNGSAQNDIYVYPDAADASFPYNFDYVLASNFQRLISAKLSFRIRAYRTYSSLTLSSTGGQSVNHTHDMTHTHSHSHTMFTWNSNGAAPGGSSDWVEGAGTNHATFASTANPPTTLTSGSNATGSSAASTGVASVDHSHTVSGTTTLNIAEDVAPVNPAITISVDGVDVTATLGGPFNSDQVEIDVTKVLSTSIKVWHTVALQPNQRVRITGILRISYYVDNRLAL